MFLSREIDIKLCQNYTKSYLYIRFCIICIIREDQPILEKISQDQSKLAKIRRLIQTIGLDSTRFKSRPMIIPDKNGPDKNRFHFKQDLIIPDIKKI